MAALFGYFDESGKAHEHKVVVFSGFVTTAKWWDDLAEDWCRLLREFNLSGLHFNEHGRRVSVIKKFIRLIKTQIEFGLSVAVDVDAFQKLPKSVQKTLGGDPHYLAFKCVVFSLLQQVAREPGDTLSFTQDEDQDTFRTCYRWYKRLKMEKADVRAQLISFCVADDKHFPQLQASDLLAALSRTEAERILLGVENDHHKLLFDYLTKRGPDVRLRLRVLILDEEQLRVLNDARLCSLPVG
jgi:hypothetical protein